MLRAGLLLLVSLLAATSVQALVLGPPRPLGTERIVPARTWSEHPRMAVSGDRALVIWHHGDGATRLDSVGRPLDVPALVLPKPLNTAGADLAGESHGWTVAWALFPFDERPSTLRLVSVSREGAIGSPREVTLPFAVEQNTPLQVARRGILLAAIGSLSTGRTRLVAVSDSGAEVRGEVNGTTHDLIATASGFALLMSGSIVRLTAEGVPAGVVELPHDVRGAAIASDGDTLYVAAASGRDTLVFRVRPNSGAAEPIARTAGLSGNVSIDVEGGEVLLASKSSKTPASPMNPTAVYDLTLARIEIDGRVIGPVELRTEIDFLSRWVTGVDAPAVGFVNGRGVVVWSEQRSWLFATVLDEGLRAAEPRLLNWRISDQTLAGTAASNDVFLVVWAEPGAAPPPAPWGGLTFAARFDARGLPLDPQPITLGEDLRIQRVESTGDGFLIAVERGNSSEYLYVGTEGAPQWIRRPELRELTVSCTAELCVAAWIELDPSPSVRISRWREGTLLDAPGILLAPRGTTIGRLALANDGRDFVVAFTRVGEADGGTILEAATISRRDDEWRLGSATPFAATTAGVPSLALLNEGDSYLATWEEWSGGGSYASRLSRDAESLDGAETSWRGWRFLHAGEPRRAGSRTLFVGGDGDVLRLFELRGRASVPLFELGRGATSLACLRSGRCLVASETRAFGDFGPSELIPRRISLRLLAPGRTRAVRH